jgi:hypothetical protein
MGKILYDGKIINISDDYSNKDFTSRILKEEKLDGLAIFGSCFSQEIPDSSIFPDDMKNVSFYNCNLDNVYIPVGNDVFGCSQRKIKIQNDLMDWVVDKDLKPIEPVLKKEFIKNNISIYPKDIPQTKMTKDIITDNLEKNILIN